MSEVKTKAEEEDAFCVLKKAGVGVKQAGSREGSSLVSEVWLEEERGRGEGE